MDNSQPQQLNTDHLEWLKNRGILDEVLDTFKIHTGYDRQNYPRIVIPVYDSLGNLKFNKYRRDPNYHKGPKYTYDLGSKVFLYNEKDLMNEQNNIIICEGELDVLILKSKGFNAVCGTGGAMTFKKEWAELFANIDTYICLDNDMAGRKGTLKICTMIPHAKVIPLPEEVGPSGDITDFFSKLNQTAEDLKILMKVAEPIPTVQQPKPKPEKTSRKNNQIAHAKAVSLKNFLEFNYSGKTNCPFHSDNTPSLQMYKDNTWYCFSCGQGRDTIDLIILMKNKNFGEAVNFLQDY